LGSLEGLGPRKGMRRDAGRVLGEKEGERNHASRPNRISAYPTAYDCPRRKGGKKGSIVSAKENPLLPKNQGGDRKEGEKGSAIRRPKKKTQSGLRRKENQTKFDGKEAKNLERGKGGLAAENSLERRRGDHPKRGKKSDQVDERDREE